MCIGLLVGDNGWSAPFITAEGADKEMGGWVVRCHVGAGGGGDWAGIVRWVHWRVARWVMNGLWVGEHTHHS